MSPTPSSDDAQHTEQVRRAVTDTVKKRLVEHAENALRPWLDILEVVSVTKPSDTTARATFRWPVQAEYLNPARGLHGGLSAGMLDVVTGLTLWPIRKPGFWMTGGTSRTLNMTYLRPAAEGEMLVCESEVVHAGQRLCLIQAVLKRERDGAVVSTCEHQKFNNDPATAAKV